MTDTDVLNNLTLSENQTGVEGETPLPSQSGQGEAGPGYYLDQYGKPHYLPAPKSLSTKSCTPKYIVYACGCGRRIVPSSCMSLNCPTCKPWVERRRTLSVFSRLTFNTTPIQRHRQAFKTVIYSVFTVPISHREWYYDRKEWQKVRVKVWKILKAKFGAKYGLEATHPVSEENPTLFHPHLNFLWVQKNGWSPFIDVTMLRTEWAGILGVNVADVHTEYSGNNAMVLHWCKYVLRTFPGMHQWTGPMRWYGNYPKNESQPQAICSQCGMPYTIVGYISKKDYDDWNEKGWMSGIDPPWERDDLIIPIVKRRSYAGERSE